MHIIVDGYNLIRQSDDLRRYDRISLEEGRRALVRLLAGFRAQRSHRITVVFDGWQGGSPQEERDCMGGVDIIYSRLGDKADEVIKRLLEAGGEETMVVTSDREIAGFAERRGKTVLGSPFFAAMLARSAAGAAPIEPAGGPAPDEEERGVAKKKGPARRLSKRQRLARVRIGKL